ncbi:axin-1 isoform X2 [Eucyclogobius newberryi]|uniref:axin-1 isoform X2 n=1 Tax=Eucyclogobius newberryi TaxID=166745 RepID=UPI003B5967C5
MSISESRDFSVDLGGSFTEDAPRPPVPGEEGQLVWSDGRQQISPAFSSKNESLKCDASVATPRRPDLDLGYEPEGSASPTPPYLKWAESLHSLLDDEDGINLFRTFLRQEECADMLDFWFACSGFRKLETSEDYEEKKVKTAKVIYKKYILDNNGIVSRQIKPATKSFIKDCVLKHHIDPAMFDQAQTEIQAMIEENTYPLFLKSDLYLEYTQTGGESPKPTSDQNPLIEVKETPHASRLQGGTECRPPSCQEPVNLCYVNPGHAPATSANDSEQQSVSSDADTLSLTDSSLDGVPPYRQRKQHRREMQDSVKANGRVPLPHIPRPNRVLKDIHVEPERFAAELISKLEGVVKEREAEEKLDEWLQRVGLEDGHDANTSMPGYRPPPGGHLPSYNPRYTDVYSPFMRDAHEENPESILDDHVQRVMKSPGGQSPGTRHSPKSRSPDGLPSSGRHTGLPGCTVQSKHPQRHTGKHHIHHCSSGKPREQLEAEAAMRVNLHWGADGHYGSKPRTYADSTGYGANQENATYSSRGGPCKRGCRKSEEVRPYDTPGLGEDVEKNQKILLWLMDGQKEVVRHKRSPYGSMTGCKKATGHEGLHMCSKDRSGSGHPTRNNIQPSHPFIQDPTMPPNPAPNPLTQLEEVCRRLEEENIKSGAVQPKQRYVMEVIQRGRSAVRPTQCPPVTVVPAVSDSELSEPEHKSSKKQPGDKMTVAYYLCEEPIPYTTSVERGRVVTLGQFKELLTKKGNYRYYFKKVSDEFDCGVVFEEVREDDAVLPIFEEKIIGKVEKIYSSVS